MVATLKVGEFLTLICHLDEFLTLIVKDDEFLTLILAMVLTLICQG